MSECPVHNWSVVRIFGPSFLVRCLIGNFSQMLSFKYSVRKLSAQRKSIFLKMRTGLFQIGPEITDQTFRLTGPPSFGPKFRTGNRTIECQSKIPDKDQNFGSSTEPFNSDHGLGQNFGPAKLICPVRSSLVQTYQSADAFMAANICSSLIFSIFRLKLWDFKIGC